LSGPDSCSVSGYGTTIGTLTATATDLAANTASESINYNVSAPPPRQLSIGDITLNEGNAGTTTATFTLSLNGPAYGGDSVTLATSNGSAIAGYDYTARAHLTMSFSAGQTSAIVTVDVLGDTTYELNETFTLTATASTNLTIADGSGQATILNDDAPPAGTVTLTLTGSSVTAGNSGLTAKGNIVNDD
jgi:Calx-beta domain